MEECDLQTLAEYLVQNYMKTNKFNEDLYDVQSNTTEITEPNKNNKVTPAIKQEAPLT